MMTIDKQERLWETQLDFDIHVVVFFFLFSLVQKCVFFHFFPPKKLKGNKKLQFNFFFFANKKTVFGLVHDDVSIEAVT